MKIQITFIWKAATDQLSIFFSSKKAVNIKSSDFYKISEILNSLKSSYSTNECWVKTNVLVLKLNIKKIY